MMVPLSFHFGHIFDVSAFGMCETGFRKAAQAVKNSLRKVFQ